jgi:hypothetical protein
MVIAKVTTTLVLSNRTSVPEALETDVVAAAEE